MNNDGCIICHKPIDLNNLLAERFLDVYIDPIKTSRRSRVIKHEQKGVVHIKCLRTKFQSKYQNIFAEGIRYGQINTKPNVHPFDKHEDTSKWVCLVTKDAWDLHFENKK